MSAPTPDTPRWLDQPHNIERIWQTICVLCVLLVVVDVAYDVVFHKHAHFSYERLPGFHAFFGFVAFVFVVIAGKRLRESLMREEDYYDE